MANPSSVERVSGPVVLDARDPVTALQRLQEYMAVGRRQEGLIPARVLRSDPNVVETPQSPNLMNKVCIAFCDLNHIVADPNCQGGRRPASTIERLTRIGVAAETYLEMVQNPEFTRMLSRRTVELIVMPQLPAIQASLTARASSGDDKAARVLYEMAKLMDLQEQDEVRRQFAHLDEAAWLAMLREEQSRISSILAEYELPEVSVCLPSTPATTGPIAGTASPDGPSSSPPPQDTAPGSAPSARTSGATRSSRKTK